MRVGPKKVIFKDITSMRSVYSIHKFDKSGFYKSLLTFVAHLMPPAQADSFLNRNENDHAYAQFLLDHCVHILI